MEAAGQVLSAFNPSVLKEPRGFLKLLQFVLAIFAFATTTSFSSSSSFVVKCNNTSTQDVSFKYEYPFDLEDVCVSKTPCDSTQDEKVCLLAGARSSAEFYVFVGVIVMLYCLAALVMYIFFDELYRKNSRIIVGDFVVSVVLTLLWLISSSAWAAGLSDVKEYTDPSEGGFFDVSRYPACKVAKDTCKVTNLGNYGSLNASVIFGFLNMLVWIGNLWFLYKETPWFKVQSKPPAGTPDPKPEDPTSGTAEGESPGGANVY